MQFSAPTERDYQRVQRIHGPVASGLFRNGITEGIAIQVSLDVPAPQMDAVNPRDEASRPPCRVFRSCGRSWRVSYFHNGDVIAVVPNR